jgi:amidase
MRIEQIRRSIRLNAIVTLDADRARNAVHHARLPCGALPPLWGLPTAHKDLLQTRGVRTTFGSPLFADNVPDKDDLIVERIRAAGAIAIGKTNTPEFGAGSQTFNRVFGATRNPYDPSRTCGGSSGGAAVALAARMLPLADGSDLGGSLRNPASFCNVLGCAPRRAACRLSDVEPWADMSVQGPITQRRRHRVFLSALVGDDRACRRAHRSRFDVLSGDAARLARRVSR